MRFPFSQLLGTSQRIFLGSVLCASLLMTGCAVPGYPYNGHAPYGAMTQAPPPPAPVGAIAVQPPSPGMVVGTPGIPYPYAYAPPIYPSPYIYAPAPMLVAPSFYSGCGNGYWYGNRFWPYRPGCAFYGGRYYGGYRANYWQGGNGNWQGGNYRGGGWNH